MTKRKGKPGERDWCVKCHGTRGGVRGNENVVNNEYVCDYCHADMLKAARPALPARNVRKEVEDRRPVVGSAEWAETRGDDIPSLDQPGDDFDMEGLD